MKDCKILRSRCKSAFPSDVTENMNKELLNILNIEVPGLVELIRSTTSDYYVKNYARLLGECNELTETNIINQLSNKLLIWYQENINTFSKNTFLYDLEQHRKSVNVLEDLMKLSKSE